MLPFFVAGLALPVTLQDRFRGRLTLNDVLSLFVGLLIVGAWEWAILLIVKSKRRNGHSRFLGRQLSSWLWAPAFAFVAGIVCGFFLLGI